MADADIRWRQRFDNFERALQVLAGTAGADSGIRVHPRTCLEIDDGEGWMAMIKARNQCSHTYNLEQAKAIAHDVIDRFAALSDPRP